MADPQFLTVPHLGRKKLARLFSKIAVQPNGCWIWTGCRDQNGYGKTSIRSEYYATHRDEVIARTGAYAASKPADERKARRRAYYLANKESALAQGRDYYLANREAVLARTGEYQRTHRKTSRARTKT